MPRTSIKVDLGVWNALRKAYQGECGSSSAQLVSQLNEAYPEERKQKDNGELSDAISDRTLNQFFKDDGKEKKLNGVYLNYLCKHLLKEKNYPDAVDKFSGSDSLKPTLPKFDLEAYLQKYQDHIRKKCGFIRIPDMLLQNQRELQQVYVNARVQEEMPSRRPKSVDQLQAELEGEKLEERPSIDSAALFSKYPHVMIWGATGAGKTTMLKNWLLSHDVSETQVPVFISLVDYIKIAQPDYVGLVRAIQHELRMPGFDESVIADWTKQCLAAGNCFVVFDGLDEIPPHHIGHIYDELTSLATQSPTNHYALSCRLGGTEYPPNGFFEVEIAQWTPAQIEQFAKKWFSSSGHPDYFEGFLQSLEDIPFASEFIHNPLLLTLLCQLYEQGYGIPRNRASLLEDAVDFYLRKWDQFRNIRREAIQDEKLSRQRRRDLFATIATRAMRKGKTFWERWELEEIIKDFIRKIPGVTQETLELDTLQILFEIEAYHGLLSRVAKDSYRFVHHSFQEYFVLQDIIETIGKKPGEIRGLLEKFLLEPDYRNIFLLLAERQRDAEPLLQEIQKYLEGIAGDDERIQEHFKWLDKLTKDAGVGTFAWRSCLFSYDLETPAFLRENFSETSRSRSQKLAARLRKINQLNGTVKKPTKEITLLLRLAVIDKLISDWIKGNIEKLNQVPKFDPVYENYQVNLKERFLELEDLLQGTEFSGMISVFQGLSQSFPAEAATLNIWREWQKSFKSVIQEHFHLGYNHKVEPETAEALNDYIYVANLLTEMLLQDIRCDQQVKEEILDSLFLPTA